VENFSATQWLKISDTGRQFCRTVYTYFRPCAVVHYLTQFGFVVFTKIDHITLMKLYENLIQRKAPMYFVWLLKHWYKEQMMQIKWGEYFSEQFHVTNGAKHGGVLSPCLFSVCLDDFFTELNNVEAGCYIGEVLLNHLMFADDICVFCPNVRGLQSILDVCQAYAELHGIIFNCNKT